jgi:hypothetical protein
MQQTRHFPRFHQNLVDRGLATWAGDAGEDGPTGQTGSTATEDDVSRILARIDPLLRRV